MALADLLDFGKTRSLDSLLLVRRGRIVLDAYYAPYTSDIPHRMNSSTKAVVGTLAAIAHKDGLLDSFDHPVLDFFADRSVADADDRKKAITVQHLLDMTSGIDWKEPLDGRPDSVIEMSRQKDWIKFILDRPMSSAPGEAFNYNSGGTHLLSGIITKLTGMSASDYAKAKLFGPLGITVSNWWRDPQGISTGGYGLALLPRDMAKIGYLYLRNGQWEDKSLLPPGWIDKVSHATVNMNMPRSPELRYSNLFWALPDKHVYMANGYHCQLIMVLPRLDIVAVTTAQGFLSVRQAGGSDFWRRQIRNGIAPGHHRLKSARGQDSRDIDREGDGNWRNAGDRSRDLGTYLQVFGQCAEREIDIADPRASEPAL